MLLGGPHDAFHMGVDLSQVFATCSARWQESESAWLANKEEGKLESRYWKLKVSFKFHGGFSKFSQQNLIGCQRTHLTRDIMCIFMPFLKTFQWEFSS